MSLQAVFTLGCTQAGCDRMTRMQASYWCRTIVMQSARHAGGLMQLALRLHALRIV
jgi:hypothetical protein